MNEADNLKQIFADRNRAAFARENDFPGGQSMIYQHITGRKPISLECAVAYSLGLGLPLSDISPRIAEIISRLPMGAKGFPNPALPAVHRLSAEETNGNVYHFDQPLAAQAAEIAEITRQLDDIGLGMLLQSARTIAKERQAFRKGNSQ